MAVLRHVQTLLGATLALVILAIAWQVIITDVMVSFATVTLV